MISYIRRKSTPLDVAKTRWQGLVSQDPAMDFGYGLSAQAYGVSVSALNEQVLKVNNLSAEIQTQRKLLEEMEREMRDLNDRYMKATAAKFGTNSMEYLAIGGVRKKDRRRRSSQSTSPDAMSSAQ
jgi:hypothetical protein